jgi:hypothetical protein
MYFKITAQYLRCALDDFRSKQVMQYGVKIDCVDGSTVYKNFVNLVV